MTVTTSWKRSFRGHSINMPSLDAHIVGPLRYHIIYLPQAGFNPLFDESAQSTEWESDALMNQATTAGYESYFCSCKKIVYYSV